jgi:hypothetical protein
MRLGLISLFVQLVMLLGGALRWKVEDRRLERSRSVMWQVSTSKAVAPTCVS